LALIEYLSVGSLLVLVFTTIWSYRYTRLAKRIDDPERRPSGPALQKTVWTGIVASTLGITFSMLVLLFEVFQLLFYMLRAPQAGVPVVQTTGGPASWVSAADVVSILALVVATFVEIAVLVFSLWLLYRATRASPEYLCAGAGDETAPA